MPTSEEITEFSLKIKEIVVSKKLSYVDAIVYHCDETGLDIEVAATLLAPSLKNKIEREAADLHFVKKRPRLPL